MKKLLSIALCATAVSAFSASSEVELGTVGVTAITSSLQNTIVAVSYADLVGEDPGIVVSNFVKTTNLTVGDQLAVFSDGKYEVWTLVQPIPPNGPKFWQKNEKKFFVNGDGELTSESGMDASLVSRSVGTGIWLCRKSKPEAAFTFYIYGKPVSALVSHIPENTWALVGNPTQGQVTIGPSTVSGVQTGDQIVTAEEDGKLHYHTFIGSEWTGSITIGPGLGFWIKTQAETTITWTTSKE